MSQLIIRPYNIADLPTVQQLHKAQGFNYELPKLEEPTVSCVVLEEGNRVTHALLIRKTAEAYWVFDPSQSNRKARLERMLVLEQEIPAFLRRLGFEDIHAWLPTEVASDKRTVATMMKLGWTRPLWTCFHREVR